MLTIDNFKRTLVYARPVEFGLCMNFLYELFLHTLES